MPKIDTSLSPPCRMERLEIPQESDSDSDRGVIKTSRWRRGSLNRSRGEHGLNWDTFLQGSKANERKNVPK